MRRLALLLTLACSAVTAVPTNQHGLRVVPDAAVYERLARANPETALVDLAGAVPGVVIDIRYATADNFMKRPLYPVARAFLRTPAAEALRRVQEDLNAQGLGLKVFDAYRPYAITEAMWEPIKDEDYVANPAKGSRHNRGAAVDLTLIDLRTGKELPMPTPYDDFTPRARHDFNDLPADVIGARERLRLVMTRHGFEPLPSEWWHYDFKGWERFDLMNVPLEAIRSGSPPRSSRP